MAADNGNPEAKKVMEKVLKAWGKRDIPRFWCKNCISPKVKMSASNPAVTQADLNQESLELEDALSSFRYYPVISYGISFKF